MAKRVVKKVKRSHDRNVALQVKNVALPKDGIVKVVVPAGIVPVVAVDTKWNVVEIAPVPLKRKRTWWQSIFGD